MIIFEFLKRILVILLFLLSFSLLHAKDSLRWNAINYNTAHGLSNNHISFTFEDIYGYQWIGTFNGLNKFNGYQFERILPSTTNPDNLYNGQIRCFLKISDSIYFQFLYRIIQYRIYR